MAEFITTKDALSVLEKLISSAEKELVLVSPYVRLAPDIRARLRDADRRGVKITLIHGKEELNDSTREVLTLFQHLEVYFFKDLHAKCYHNGRRMIITSLNLIESSEHNFEMGVAVESGDPVFTDALREIEFVRQAAERRTFAPKPALTARKPAIVSTAKGFCIRCAKVIDLDSERPYCTTCFVSWSRWENWGFEEKVCHRCGRPGATSREKPQCYKCYKSLHSRS